MKKFIARSNTITSTALLTLWCCLAQADDIEVYRGGAVGGSPAAMLVIDTSGSMNDMETVVAPTYDPSVNYKDIYKERPDGQTISYQFDHDLYYFSNTYDDGYLFNDDINNLLARPAHPNTFVCKKAQESIEENGFRQDSFKRWDATLNSWEPSANSGSNIDADVSFTKKYGDINSFDDLKNGFNRFRKFRNSFEDFAVTFENDYPGGDDQLADDFDDAFNEDYDDLKNFRRRGIRNWGDFRQFFNSDFERFKTFFDNGGSGLAIPQTPIGNPNNLTALIECKSDEGTDPNNQYINTDPNTNAQYKNVKVAGYENQWKYKFTHVYHGNYLNYKTYTNFYEDVTQQSRMQITVDAAKHMVNTTGGIILGLASFDKKITTDGYKDGGDIDVAANNIDDIRDDLLNTLTDYKPNGGTPLSESYYETALYLRGKTPYFGDESVSASKSGNKYNTPITSGCQGISNIVLFTDGAPTVDDAANKKIEALLDDAGINFKTDPRVDDDDRKVLTNSCSSADLNISVNGGGKGHGSCAEELAFYLANVDQLPDLPGKQVIHTYTIGGFLDEDKNKNSIETYMTNIAKYGEGKYTPATSKDEIIKSFQDSVAVLLEEPVTFVAPSVAANSYNSLEHLDQLYYAMFVPSADNNWQGNLKSYRLSPDGLVVDANGNEAIDKNSGLFKDSSRSYWTAKDTVDGDKVILGGAAANLTKNKNIFTHLSNTKGPLTQTLSTSSISKARLGLTERASTTEHSALIDWMNRKEGANGSRQQMEDPLHSRPIVVNYGYSQDPVTKNLISDSVIFVGTNSGYLHAFKADKDNFEELFSYIPKELLSNANLYRTKDVDQSKVYGVDGPINYWHVDANQDLQVDTGEKVYLFFGLRRGGRHYYALDITDKSAPKFQWQISGGQDGDFDKMGQSWSQMKLAKVRWGDSGKTKVVLLVGGGYDTAEDNRDSREVSNVGNAIYMIDPETGGLLWSASNTGADTNLTNMTSSITSDIKTIDFDGDQITDYFFVSDLGGRVWRFDINPNKEKINEANFINSAGMIFDANKDSSKYQRFYDAPSISYFSNPKTKEKFLTISIGSGFRASPLKNGSNDAKDSFYVIKDSHVTVAPSSYTLPARSDFKDITSAATAIKRDTVDVWKYDLADGEKILSSPLTANGNIFFTTFLPSSTAASSDSCNTDIGSSRVYTVNFLGDKTDLGLLAPAISSAAMPNIGIPPQVVELITTETGQKLFCDSNPGHESCKPKPCESTGTCPDECESTGSVILSGTHVVGGSTLRCDLLKKDYWRSL